MKIIRLLTLPLLAALALPALAQTATIGSVIRYRVKADRAADFRAAVQEYSATLKKANYDRNVSWLVSQTGDAEYLQVRRMQGYAPLDLTNDPKLKEVSADLARLLARMLNCTESRSRMITEAMPELSLPPSPEMPKMFRVLWSDVKPGSMDEYTALIKGEIVPGMKKGGVKYYQTSRIRLGGSTNMMISVQGLDSWADLDKPSPLVQAMGQDGYRKAMQKRAQLITSSEAQILRLMPEMSYVAPAK